LFSGLTGFKDSSISRALDKNVRKDHVDGWGKPLEIIKMYPIVIFGYKKNQKKLKICTVLAKNILKLEY
jgi:hypothetical protein